MKAAMKNDPRKKRYKVVFLREGEPKVKHIDYVWATSAREAEQIVRSERGKGDGRIRKVRAGALG
jgi:hypothetical protein